jgi:DNA-binding transcriptional regulator YiaG
MKKALNAVERDLVSGLKGLLQDLKGGGPLPAKYNRRQVIIDLKPRKYGPRQVKATRSLLAASQTLFAQFLGVSAQSVRAWEQGGKTPSDIACRFMDEIQRNPEYWRGRLKESTKLKSAGT